MLRAGGVAALLGWAEAAVVPDDGNGNANVEELAELVRAKVCAALLAAAEGFNHYQY